MAEQLVDLEECLHYTSSLICPIEDMDKLIMYTDRGCYDCDGRQYDEEGEDRNCNHFLSSIELYRLYDQEKLSEI